jgi:hypothetical protein
MTANGLHRRFSTEGLPAAEKFDALREHCAPLFDVERPEDCDASLEAKGDAYLIGELWLFENAFPAVRYVRSSKRVRRDGIDQIVIKSVSNGSAQGEANGASVERRDGALWIIDCAQPFFYEATQSRGYGAMLSRRLLEDRLGDLAPIFAGLG